MVHITSILSMAALASASIMATEDNPFTDRVHIDFKRFDDNQCAAEHHIRKTTDMHDSACKSYSHQEVPFRAFNFKITKHADILSKKTCEIIVHDDKDCKGRSITFGDISGREDTCHALPADFEGRSIKFECKKKEEPQPQTLPPPVKPVVHLAKPSPETKVVTMEKPTVTTTVPLEPQTVTVVPHRSKGKQICHYEGDEWEEDA